MEQLRKWEQVINSPLLKIDTHNDVSTVLSPTSIDDIYEIIFTLDREYIASFSALYYRLFVTSDASYKVSPYDINYETLDELYNMISVGEIPSIHVWTPRSVHSSSTHAKKLANYFDRVGASARICRSSELLFQNKSNFIVLNSDRDSISAINKIKLLGIDTSLFEIDMGFIIHDDFNDLITKNNMSRQFLKHQVSELSKFIS